MRWRKHSLGNVVMATSWRVHTGVALASALIELLLPRLPLAMHLRLPQLLQLLCLRWQVRRTYPGQLDECLARLRGDGRFCRTVSFCAMIGWYSRCGGAAVNRHGGKAGSRIRHNRFSIVRVDVTGLDPRPQ